MEKLNEDSLGQVAGGYLFNAKDIEGADKKYPWEIIDGDGDVKGRFKEYKEAAKTAKEMGIEPMVIDWERLQELRRPVH
ncbi:MAG: hypothetical protein K5989_09920 [Lachnospiraceae bacterium]|nr:hypothetical protein [Lachnospiraceae bacterium]